MTLAQSAPEVYTIDQYHPDLENVEEGGFLENSWVGKTVNIRENTRIIVTMPDPRCVMTTLGQGEIPRDNNVLRTLVKHNRLDIMGAGKYPCAGVYAVIGNGGTVRVGDAVEVG